MHRTRLLVALVFAALLLAAPAAPASSSGVVVSQVYGGGGNSGASFTNDFVELFNAGSSSISLDGWTVQYASAAGTSWQATALAGSIAPGHHYLVQLSSAASVGGPLPTPDATGTSNLAVSGGKVAVVTNATALGCGATAGSCSGVSGIEDFVGYGSAADYEGVFGRGGAEQLDRGDSRRCRLHGHRLERRRLRCGHADAAQQRLAGDQLHRRRWVVRRDDRLGERRRRHPEQPLARARAARDQLRRGRVRHDRRRRSPSGSRSTATTRPATR